MDSAWLLVTEVYVAVALVALLVVAVVVVRLVLKARKLVRSLRGSVEGIAKEASETHVKVRQETRELKGRVERVGAVLRAGSGRVRDTWRGSRTGEGAEEGS